MDLEQGFESGREKVMASVPSSAAAGLFGLFSVDLEFRFNQENNPNARILLTSIRRAGYTLETAIGDLVDNCLDARAETIVINLDRNENEWIVSVADSGIGMDRVILDQMLRLGSDTEHDLATDLGAFGLGSTTASLSLGKRQHVVTTTGGESFLSGATDLDATIKAGNFVKHLDMAQPSEVELFKDAFTRWNLAIPDTGTLVQISKCDNIGRMVLKPALEAVKKYISTTYRYFIDAGKKFYINGELVSAHDPLMRNNPETQILLEDTFDYVFPKSHPRAGDRETIGCILVNMPDFGGIEENKQRGLTSDNSGFYVLRNRRQIVAATSLGLYTRHPEFNRFRGELLFPATMDQDLGVSFLKSAWDVKPSQSLRDRLEQEVMPYARQARSLYKKSKKLVDDDISHEEAQKLIRQRAAFLRKPKTQIEKRASPTTLINESTDQKPVTGQTRSPFQKVQAGIADLVDFKVKELGATAPFYEASLEGRRVIVTYNKNHPFYERFLIENRDNRSLTNALDYLMYSLATAELLARDEDTYRFIERMREDVSFNLRQLLTT